MTNMQYLKSLSENEFREWLSKRMDIWIKDMNIWELADYLALRVACNWCDHLKNCTASASCGGELLNWLREEHS